MRPISRRKARECALIALYELDFGSSEPAEVTERVLEQVEMSDVVRDYARQLIEGVWDHKASLGQNVAGFLREYDYNRLAAIDRTILLIAAYELMFVPDVPPAVTINEAVELAKQYSTAESGKFVNGVLGRLLKHSPKAEWDPATAPAEPTVESPEPAVETVEVDSEEAEAARKFGQWTIGA